MSEHNLWTMLRNGLGHRGHLVRLEFNPTPGIPDVSYCLKGVEGFIELKHAHEFPARSTTAVFGNQGLRDDQIAWIHTRTRHGGRVRIIAQVDDQIYLIPGSYCRQFNEMNGHALAKSSAYYAQLPLCKIEWNNLYSSLRN